MDIVFSNKKLEKTCADERRMQREFGTVRSKKVKRRLAEIDAASNLDEFGKLPGPRCHELGGDRKGQLSIDLDHPYRLIIEPNHNPIPAKDDGGLDWSQVTAIRIIEIEDTH